MQSDAYRRFLDSLQGGPDWRDGLDLAAFGRATPDEQKQLVATTSGHAPGRALAGRDGGGRWARGVAADPCVAASVRWSRERGSGQVLLQLAFGEVTAALAKLVRDAQQGRDARIRAMQVLQDVPGWDITYLLAGLLDDNDAAVRLEALLVARSGCSKPRSWQSCFIRATCGPSPRWPR